MTTDGELQCGLGSGTRSFRRTRCAMRWRQVGLLEETSSELPARADVELGEHLAQMPFDRTRTEEELPTDVRGRQTVPGEPCDLHLLRCELVVRLHLRGR
jgi:hypothetical protein